MSKQILSHERLKSLLDYNKDTGAFTRRKATTSRGSFVGDQMLNGYWRVGVDGRRYLAHRLAWFYVYGVWPKHEIDHIDRDKQNNRITNLRDVVPSENQHNRGGQVNNLSGARGVSWCNRTLKWVAQLTVRGTHLFLGRHSSIESASTAYEAAKRIHHPTAPQGNHGK